MRDLQNENLTDEEISMLSEPVEAPRGRGGAFEAMWAVEDNLELSEDAVSESVARPIAEWETFEKTGTFGPKELSSVKTPRGRGSAFEEGWPVKDNFGFLEDMFSEDRVWRVGESGAADLGWFEPVARTVWNLPGGAVRGVGDLLALVSPYHLGKGLNIRASEIALAHQMAGDDDSQFRHFMDLQAQIREDQGFTETQQVIGQLVKEVVGPFAEATFANPYDPANVDLFDPEMTQARMPALHAVGEQVESVLPVSPWDTEYNPEWSENLSRLIQEESGEFVFEIALGAAFGGGGLASGALRRTARGVKGGLRASKKLVDDISMKGVFDLEDIDLAKRQRGATVGIDFVRDRQQGQSSFGGTGAVVRDAEGRTFVSTAAHVVTGKEGRVVDDFSGIRVTSGEGEIGTVHGVAAIDLQQDVALLEVTGISEAFEIGDRSLSAQQSLLGRSGYLESERISDIETGKYLGTTSLRGVAGESGAPIVAEGDQLTGLYLGRLGDKSSGLGSGGDLNSTLTLHVPDQGSVGKGTSIYAPVTAVQDLLESAQSGGRVQLGADISRRAAVEGLHYRSARGELDLHGSLNIDDYWEQVRARDDSYRRYDTPDRLLSAVEVPELQRPERRPDFENVEQLALDLHSADNREFFEGRWHDRFAFGRSSEVSFPALSVSDDLSELFSTVSEDPSLFFRVGTRGEDVSALRTLDIEQTREYREWYESERPPWEEFSFVGGGGIARETLLGGIESQEIHAAAVMGLQDLVALGRDLGGRDIGEGQVLQVLGGYGPRNLPVDISTYERGQRLIYEPEVLLELEVPTVDKLRGIYRDVTASGGVTDYSQRALLQEPESIELGIEYRIAQGNVLGYERVPVVESAGSSDSYDVENWSMADLQSEIGLGATYGKGKAREEIDRRRVAELTGDARENALREIEKEKDLEAQTAVEQRSDTEFTSEHDVAQREYAEYIGDISEGFDQQVYKSEAWEPSDGPGDGDETGVIYTGWIDEYGDFSQFGGEGEPELKFSDVFKDSVESEKVSSMESMQVTAVSESGFLPETQVQIENIFSAVIQEGEEYQAAMQGSAELRKAIVSEADKRLPKWREWRRISERRHENITRPEMKPFYDAQVSIQAEGWRETGDRLWAEGRYDAYEYHVNPVRNAAIRAVMQEGGTGPREPRWIRERREAFVSDSDLLRQGREQRQVSRDRAEPVTDMQMLEMQRLERPRSGYLAEFREQVYREESEFPGIQEDLEDFSLLWHQRDVRETRQAGVGREQATSRDIHYALSPDVLWGFGDQDSPIDVWGAARRADYSQAISEGGARGSGNMLSAVDLAELRLSRDTVVAERNFAEKARSMHEIDATMRRTAQQRAFEQERDPAFDVFREAQKEKLRKSAERARQATLKEQGKKLDLHSMSSEDVSPLDLERPRARRADFGGIQSDRTYGLELEVITDLTRAEMEGELDWQIGQGLAVEYDLSIKTVRSEIALEHHPPVNVSATSMHLPGEEFRVEAADYQEYQATYTDVPGYENVYRDDFETRYGHELVFPKMQGESGIELIAETFQRLKEFETELNTSMGMHIHVGAADLSNYDLVGVWGAFAARENIIDMMHDPSRRGEGGIYAKSLLSIEPRDLTIGQLLRLEMGETDIIDPNPGIYSRLKGARKTSLLSGLPREQFLDKVGYGDRYQKLNLREGKYRTIEYRQPAPTLDIGEAEQHIGFITDFVDEFSGKPLEWVFEKDPRLKEEFAGLDLVFERPSEQGQLVLPLDLHSKDVTSDHVWRFLSPADREGIGLDRATFGALSFQESVDILSEQYPEAETLGSVLARAEESENIFFRSQPEGAGLLDHRSFDLSLTRDFRGRNRYRDFPDDALVDFRGGEDFITRGGVFASKEWEAAHRYLRDKGEEYGSGVEAPEGGNQFHIFRGLEFSRESHWDPSESIVRPVEELYRVDKSMFSSSGRLHLYAGGDWWEGSLTQGFEEAPAELFAVDPRRRHLQEQRSLDLHSAGGGEVPIDSIVDVLENRDDWFLRVAHQDENLFTQRSSANDPRHIEFIQDMTRLSRGETVSRSGRFIEMFGKVEDFSDMDFRRAAQNIEDIRPWIERASGPGESLDLRFKGVYAHPVSYIKDSHDSLGEYFEGQRSIYDESDADIRASGTTFMGGISPADANVSIFTASDELDPEVMGSLIYPFETIVRPERLLVEFSPDNFRRGVGEYRDLVLHSADESIESRQYEKIPPNFFDEGLLHEEIPPDFFEDIPVPEESFGTEIAKPLAIATEKYPPTASQQRALEHRYGPAVVMAGPGSGKSRTLIERLKYLNRENIAMPDDVLTLVFGKKAQLELKERTRELGGDWNISTIDAFAYNLVRENYGELGYSAPPRISTLSFEQWLPRRGDKLRELGVSANIENQALVKKWGAEYEETREGFLSGKEDYSGLSEDLQGAIHAFRLEKLRSNELDFTDATLQSAYLLEKHDALRAGLREEFPFVQIDEYQDVSVLQSRLLSHLSENLWAVGDIDQSIMSFRGGAGEVMQDSIYQGASFYNIEENFRSTPEIVGAAQGFIKSNLGRMEIRQSAIKESGEPVSLVNISTSTSESTAIQRITEQIEQGQETAILTRTRRERDKLQQKIGYRLRDEGWSEEDLGSLIFETMHASKGREFEHVILPVNVLNKPFGSVGQRDITLPTYHAKTAQDFAEEERIFYVGMTRAEDKLTVMGDPYHPYMERLEDVIGTREKAPIEQYFEQIPPADVAVTRGIDAIETQVGSGKKLLSEQVAKGTRETDEMLASVESFFSRVKERLFGGKDKDLDLDLHGAEQDGDFDGVFLNLKSDLFKNLELHGLLFSVIEPFDELPGIGEKSYETINPFVDLGGTTDKEGYRIGGFEFDVHESPFPGFNPWLDPVPEGNIASTERYPANPSVNQSEMHPAFQSVVNIEMQAQWLDWLDNPPMGAGTGFFIDKGVIATNYHVLTVLGDDQGEEGYRPGYRISEGHVNVPGIEKPLAIEKVLAADPANDLALLAVEHPEGIEPLRLSQRVPSHFDRITAIGYPGGEGDIPQRDVGRYREPVWGEIEDTQISGLFDFFVSGMGVFPGESGSPLLDDRDEVIGVLFGGGSEIAKFEQGGFSDIFVSSKGYAAAANVSEVKALYEGYLASGNDRAQVKDGFQSSSDVYYASPMHSVVNLEEHPVGPNYKRQLEGNQFAGVGYGIGQDFKDDVDVIQEALREVRVSPVLKEDFFEGDLGLDTGYLYRLRNLETDQAYVGLSKDHPLKSRSRIREHFSGTGSKEIAGALDEFDPSDFSAEIWEIPDVGYKELGVLEKALIAETGSFGAGYNLTPGGEIGQNFRFDEDFARSPDAVPSIGYERFESADVALALPGELFEIKDYLTLDEEDMLRRFHTSRLRKRSESTRRMPLTRDALTPMERQSFVPVEDRIDITFASQELLQEVPGFHKGLAERVVKYQEKFGDFETLDSLSQFRGVSDARFKEMSRYLQPIKSQGGIGVFSEVSPVVSDMSRESFLDVDIAGVEDFQKLSGISEALAERIVEDREARGVFGSIENLERVRGVSSGLVEKLRSRFEPEVGLPSFEISGLLSNITPRNLGSPALQEVLGVEGTERLYEYNKENIPAFGRSERIRALGEVGIMPGLQAYHETWQPMDVDTASWEMFEDLPGVSESLARRIVEDREVQGAFGDYRELTRVKGISTGLVEKWSQYFEGFEGLRDFGISSIQEFPQQNTVLDFEIGTDRPLGIDINEATFEDWEQVSGVTSQMAHRIIRHRAGGGDFEGLEDLQERVGLSRDVYSRLLPRQRIDLNQASAMQLSFLPGVGGTTADRIVGHREQYGEFDAFSDLLGVEGVGESLYEQLSAYQPSRLVLDFEGGFALPQESVDDFFGLGTRRGIGRGREIRPGGRGGRGKLDQKPPSLYDVSHLQEVSVESGFQMSLRKFQDEHGKSVFPSDKERMRARQPSWIDEISYGEGFSYLAQDTLRDAPGQLFRELRHAGGINEQVEERLKELEKEQSEIKREIQSDRTLTFSQRNELVSKLEISVAEDREYLESQEVSTGDVVKGVAGSVASSLVQRGVGFAYDKARSGVGQTAASITLKGAGTTLKGLGGKALSALKPLASVAAAPVALVAATAYIGKKSLDAGYAETVETQEESEKAFYQKFSPQQSSEEPEADRLPKGFKIEHFLTDQVITLISRKLRVQTERGISR